MPLREEEEEEEGVEVECFAVDQLSFAPRFDDDDDDDKSADDGGDVDDNAADDLVADVEAREGA